MKMSLLFVARLSARLLGASAIRYERQCFSDGHLCARVLSVLTGVGRYCRSTIEFQHANQVPVDSICRVNHMAMFARWLSLVFLLVTGPACGAPYVVKVALPTNDITYDPFSDQILASVPSRAGALRGNTITPIDPYSGALGTSVFVASEPNKLALADDGSLIYVGSNSTNFITPFSLMTMTPGSPFAIGGVTQRVDDMDVAPGNPSALAVATMNNSGSPRGTGVAVFVNGVRLPKGTESINNVIEFGATAGVLYGQNNEISSRELRSYSVDLSPTGGLVEGFSVDQIINHTQQHMEFDNDRLYFTNGQVIDPSIPAPIGSFNASGPVEPVSSTGHTYFFDNNSKKLKAFRQATFVPIGEMSLPQVTGAAINLIALGNSALAFATTNDQLFIVRLRGDFDSNGVVAAGDYDAWKASYGSTTNLVADANHDGIINAADYVIWRDDLGQTLAGSMLTAAATQVAVPEPASAMLLWGIVFSLAARLLREGCHCRRAR